VIFENENNFGIPKNYQETTLNLSGAEGFVQIRMTNNI
jgi:hypothetical protein